MSSDLFESVRHLVAVLDLLENSQVEWFLWSFWWYRQLLLLFSELMVWVIIRFRVSFWQDFFLWKFGHFRIRSGWMSLFRSCSVSYSQEAGIRWLHCLCKCQSLFVGPGVAGYLTSGSGTGSSMPNAPPPISWNMSPSDTLHAILFHLSYTKFLPSVNIIPQCRYWW